MNRKGLLGVVVKIFLILRVNIERKTKKYPPEKKKKIIIKSFFCFVIRLYFSIHFFSVESFCFLYFIKTQLTHNKKKLNKEPANNEIK